MSSKRVTSQDVAKAAGVSRTTVSMVLNNVRDVRISEETRHLVIKTAEQLGYVPNAAAQALVSNRSQIVGLVMARESYHIIADAFLNMILDGSLKSVHVHGMRLLIEIVEPKHQQEAYLRLARAKHIDGLILAGVRQDDEGIDILIREGIPVVLIGSLPEVSICMVDVDNRAAAYMATAHLIHLGHTKIACITNAALEFSAPAQRLDGYRDALAAAGIPFDERLVRAGDYDLQSGYWQMIDLLESAVPFSAAFVASDVVAHGAISALQERGLRIPGDVAIVGFDDVPFARFMNPPLTTIHVPAQQMAELACEILISRITSGDLSPRQIILPTELVVRASCGAKPDFAARETKNQSVR
jgi:DNA-binding LacI/PurR family transcriptional regulator